MGIEFPCRHDSPLTGEPTRARPCRCGPRQVLDEDGLCLCGRWPEQTVNLTFAQQAWRNSKRQKPGFRYQPVETGFVEREERLVA